MVFIVESTTPFISQKMCIIKDQINSTHWQKNLQIP